MWQNLNFGIVEGGSLEVNDKPSVAANEAVAASEGDAINASLFEESNKAMADQEQNLQSTLVERQNKALEQMQKMSNSLKEGSEIIQESFANMVEQASELIGKCNTLTMQLMLKTSPSLKIINNLTKRRKKR